LHADTLVRYSALVALDGEHPLVQCGRCYFPGAGDRRERRGVEQITNFAISFAATEETLLTASPPSMLPTKKITFDFNHFQNRVISLSNS
jgi:hypothetical protein